MAAAAIVVMLSGAASPPVPRGPVASDITLVAADRAALRPSRPSYRYSVIPGGVYSAEELVAAVDRDPVVSEHYGSAVPAAVRTVALSAPRRVYMSYRIGDQIYWTSNKVLLNAGEMTLTNGDVEIRARCGNLLSETEMFPQRENEPDVVEFDRLVEGEPDLLASWGFAFPPAWLGAVPGAVSGLTSPGIAGALPFLPIGLPGGGSDTSWPGAPGANDVFGLPVVPDDITGSTAGLLPFPVFPANEPPGIAPPPENDPPAGDGPPGSGTPPKNGAEDSTPPTVVPPGDSLPPGDYFPTPEEKLLTVTAVPEPGTFVLLGSALIGVATMRIRQRARNGRKTRLPG